MAIWINPLSPRKPFIFKIIDVAVLRCFGIFPFSSVPCETSIKTRRGRKARAAVRKARAAISSGYCGRLEASGGIWRRLEASGGIW